MDRPSRADVSVAGDGERQVVSIEVNDALVTLVSDDGRFEASGRCRFGSRDGGRLVRRAAACSLAVHLLAVSLLFLFGRAPLDRFTLSGRRNAVCIQCAWSPPPEPDTEERAVEVASQEAEAAGGVVESLESLQARQVAVRTSMPRGTTDRLDRPIPHATRTAVMRRATVLSARRTPVRPHPTDRLELEPISHRHRAVRSPRVHVARLSVALQQRVGTNDREPPVLDGNRPPDYPAEAIARGIEGTVVLRLTIDEQGRVIEVEVARSSGHAILDEAAVAAVRSWRGRPARRGGRDVRIRQLLPIRFRL